MRAPGRGSPGLAQDGVCYATQARKLRIDRQRDGDPVTGSDVAAAKPDRGGKRAFPPIGRNCYHTFSTFGPSAGVPRETHPGERRVSLTPQGAQILLKAGFKSVLVESGAGKDAGFNVSSFIGHVTEACVRPARADRHRLPLVWVGCASTPSHLQAPARTANAAFFFLTSISSMPPLVKDKALPGVPARCHVSNLFGRGACRMRSTPRRARR